MVIFLNNRRSQWSSSPIIVLSPNEKAFGALVKADASPLEESSNLDLLRRMIHDKSGAVREALYSTIGTWMLELRDRYGFAPKLLPIFVAGYTDEITNVQLLCTRMMDEMGAMYEKDYADQLKDEMDYSPDFVMQGECMEEEPLANRDRPTTHWMSPFVPG